MYTCLVNNMSLHEFTADKMDYDRGILMYLEKCIEFER